MADDKKIIFSMVGVGKLIPPSRQILKDIYLSFFYGAKIGIIGLNGSGKSSLMKIIAGVDKDYQGEVVFSPGYSVGYLEQEPKLDDTKTVKEVVQEAVQETVDLLKEYDEVNNAFAEPDADFDKLIARQGELTELLEAHDAWNLDTKLERAMDALRCPDEDQLVKNLSGGERRRVALCRLLLQEPDILLLDEPTNHLDAESIDWLEQHLQQYKGTVIAVTHDRYFLDHVAGWILELDRGEGIPWKGNYSSWLEQKTARLAMEEKQESKRRKTLQRELEWVRMAPKARHAKGKARLAAYDRLLNEDVKEKEQNLEIFIPNGPRLGNKVLEVNGVSKAYGDKLLYENLTFSLPPAGIVGIIGPNGCGKTTLLRVLSGLSDSRIQFRGNARFNPAVRPGWFDQHHENTLDPERSILDNIMRESVHPEHFARTVMACLGIRGDDIFKTLKLLSGGERAKAALGKLLLMDCNMLLLDEPTNHLDLFTMEELEKLLSGYGGTLLFVSHDEEFIRKTATRIICFENESLKTFEGGWEEMKAPRQKDQEKENRNLEISRLEMQMAVLSARLSAPKKGDRPDLLQEEYLQLAEKLRELKRSETR
jgi:ATP-binding cassette ChvD family protein